MPIGFLFVSIPFKLILFVSIFIGVLSVSSRVQSCGVLGRLLVSAGFFSCLLVPIAVY